MLQQFIILQQATEQIKEKIANAPDKGYEIGIAIGTFLPFVLLIAVAYWFYRAAKNRKDLED